MGNKTTRVFFGFRFPGFPVAAAIVLAILTAPVAAQGPDVRKGKPAAENEPKVVRFETADKVRIEGEYWAAEAKEGQKAPAAILIHMYPADRTSWKPLIPDLHKAGFAILAYDIRGHGGSTSPEDKKLKEAYDKRDPKLFAEAWKDVEAAKKWLGEQPGCDTDRIALIGASIGCSISIDYAGMDKAVKAVVCLSPGTKYMDVDSIAHIKKCADRPILLISPENEYKAVEELIKASGGKAKGEKHPGSHGTGMFEAPSGKELIAHIVDFVKEAAGSSPDRRKQLALAVVGPNGPLTQAILMFKFDTGSYPGSLGDLFDKPKDKPVGEKWKGPYLKDPEGLKDPWGNEYRYLGGDAARHNKDSFDLWSIGPDGQDGTGDDIGNWPKP